MRDNQRACMRVEGLAPNEQRHAPAVKASKDLPSLALISPDAAKGRFVHRASTTKTMRKLS